MPRSLVIIHHCSVQNGCLYTMIRVQRQCCYHSDSRGWCRWRSGTALQNLAKFLRGVLECLWSCHLPFHSQHATVAARPNSCGKNCFEVLDHQLQHPAFHKSQPLLRFHRTSQRQGMNQRATGPRQSQDFLSFDFKWIEQWMYILYTNSCAEAKRLESSKTQ